jgi:hypothetical protein
MNPIKYIIDVCEKRGHNSVWVGKRRTLKSHAKNNKGEHGLSVPSSLPNAAR